MFKKSFLTAILIFLIVGTGRDLSLPKKAYAYSEQIYFIHQDNLGSVVAVTNDATVSAQMDYSSYGNSVGVASGDHLQQNNGIPTERSYTGQINDQNTALQYYNARYYDPILSRFISADSVQGGNRYAYVGNNPISRSDPSGNKMDMGGDGGGGGGYTPPINTNYPAYDNINTPYQSAPSYANDEIHIMLANEANSYHGPYNNTRGLATAATYLTGASCAVGFLPGCVAVNIMLGSAWVEQIASGGQSKELTEPALNAATIATGGQDLIQGVATARSIGQSVRDKYVTSGGQGSVIQFGNTAIKFGNQKELAAQFEVLQDAAAVNGLMVKPKSFFSLGRFSFYTMERIKGSTLSDAAFIFDDNLVMARDELAQLHSAGIVHGDLVGPNYFNSRNILISQNTGRIRLIDPIGYRYGATGAVHDAFGEMKGFQSSMASYSLGGSFSPIRYTKPQAEPFGADFGLNMVGQ